MNFNKGNEVLTFGHYQNMLPKVICILTIVDVFMYTFRSSARKKIHKNLLILSHELSGVFKTICYSQVCLPEHKHHEDFKTNRANNLSYQMVNRNTRQHGQGI